jgi:hypothetical protein
MPLKLSENEELALALLNRDVRIRRAAQILADKLNACMTTAEIDQVADEYYPETLIITPPNADGISRVYGTYHIKGDRTCKRNL